MTQEQDGDWKVRAETAEAALAQGKARRKAAGRHPNPAKSPDAKLIARVRRKLRLKQVDVAAAL